MIKWHIKQAWHNHQDLCRHHISTRKWKKNTVNFTHPRNSLQIELSASKFKCLEVLLCFQRYSFFFYKRPKPKNLPNSSGTPSGSTKATPLAVNGSSMSCELVAFGCENRELVKFLEISWNHLKFEKWFEGQQVVAILKEINGLYYMSDIHSLWKCFVVVSTILQRFLHVLPARGTNAPCWAGRSLGGASRGNGASLQATQFGTFGTSMNFYMLLIKCN